MQANRTVSWRPMLRLCAYGTYGCSSENRSFPRPVRAWWDQLIKILVPLLDADQRRKLYDTHKGEGRSIYLEDLKKEFPDIRDIPGGRHCLMM